MSNKGILKNSDSFAENIKLTKTDLEVLNKHVSFFPSDLLHKERAPTHNYNKYNNYVIRPLLNKNLKQNTQQPIPVEKQHSSNLKQNTQQSIPVEKRSSSNLQQNIQRTIPIQYQIASNTRQNDVALRPALPQPPTALMHNNLYARPITRQNKVRIGMGMRFT